MEPIDNFIAHIKSDSNGSKIVQTCSSHLENSAKHTAASLKELGLYNAGYFAGLHHDIGKMKPQFTEYIQSASEGNSPAKGSVIHTFAGVKHILENYWKKFPDSSDFDFQTTSEVLAYAVGAHHSLFDCVDGNHESGFVHRLTSMPDGDENARLHFSNLYTQKSLDEIFKNAASEITAIEVKCFSLCESDESEAAFLLGLITRLITSAVMDGDRRDTAEFMSNIIFEKDASTELWKKLLARIETKLSLLDQSTVINKTRNKISDICRNTANDSPGIYRLNVPTGGGKTLSSLRYALAHAASYNKKRIIFTSPLLSILDQNSKIIRDCIDDDNIILEHHSNVVRDDFSNENDNYKSLCESWSSPIIITTLVQLLNTMFDGKSSSVRRFHSLTNSVIVIDEVQTVPVKLLTMFNLTVSFLAHCCNATIVLCSATQPYLEGVPHPIRTKIRDIIPASHDEFDIFKRTNIEFSGSYKLDDIPNLANEILNTTNSLLIVCNKKSQAEKIYNQMQFNNYEVFYLSASLCPEHRKNTLADLYTSLKCNSRKTVCVSTQVIEAGVDISFGSVIRFEAGLDSIIQAAGRCNRNGEAGKIKPVYIVRILDEDLSHLSEIKNAKTAMQQLLTSYSDNPELFDNDISSEKSIKYYYTQLYNNFTPSFDYSLGHEKGTLYSMLSWNDSMVPANDNVISKYVLRQAFATAGKLFSVFDTDTMDVIVPYGKGKSIISELLSDRAKYDYTYTKKLLDEAKHYSVSLYKYSSKQAEATNALIPLAGGIAFGVEDSFYNINTGISTNFETEAKKCNILIL